MCPAEHIPVHVHGTSKYYYNLGCTHPLCVAVAALAKAANRARHRSNRVRVDGHWEHPDLKPFDSDSPRRHGTQYARSTFGCECTYCKPDLVAFPGTSLLCHGHVDSRIAGAVLAVGALILAWHVAPTVGPLVVSLLHLVPVPRVSLTRAGMVALTAYTTAPLPVFVALALVVATAWSFVRPERSTTP